MRSVIPGMERLSSLVRLGPSCRRHRIVPFQRPSMTRIIASTGHSPTSFFETGIFPSNTDKYDSTLTLVSIHHTLRVMEVFLSNKHLPRLFVQTLNERRVALFDEFIHPEYNNHNAYVEPGPAGVKAFFRHYLDAFPDTKVVMEDVIEEGDRITARFTYNGTFSNPFMGYRPNSAVVQMRSIDIWRVADGKFVEHWDELNLLEVFQQIGAATVRKPEGQ